MAIVASCYLGGPDQACEGQRVSGHQARSGASDRWTNGKRDGCFCQLPIALGRMWDVGGYEAKLVVGWSSYCLSLGSDPKD
jgi:hypothetical protein